MRTAASIYSGVGGADLGVEQAGFRLAWQCEADPWRREVLAAHWPDVPCYRDAFDLWTPEPVDLLVVDPAVGLEWWDPIWPLLARLQPATVLGGSHEETGAAVAQGLAAAGYVSLAMGVRIATTQPPDTTITRYRALHLAVRDGDRDALAAQVQAVGDVQSVMPTDTAKTIVQLVEHVVGLPANWSCLCQRPNPDACGETTARLVAVNEAMPPATAQWAATALAVFVPQLVPA